MKLCKRRTATGKQHFTLHKAHCITAISQPFSLHFAENINVAALEQLHERRCFIASSNSKNRVRGNPRSFCSLFIFSLNALLVWRKCFSSTQPTM